MSFITNNFCYLEKQKCWIRFWITYRKLTQHSKHSFSTNRISSLVHSERFSNSIWKCFIFYPNYNQIWNPWTVFRQQVFQNISFVSIILKLFYRLHRNNFPILLADMFDKVMEANGNSVNPLLKYTPENFDDIEKESKQNQQQFYNGEYYWLSTTECYFELLKKPNNYMILSIS